MLCRGKFNGLCKNTNDIFTNTPYKNLECQNLQLQEMTALPVDFKGLHRHIQ